MPMNVIVHWEGSVTTAIVPLFPDPGHLYVDHLAEIWLLGNAFPSFFLVFYPTTGDPPTKGV